MVLGLIVWGLAAAINKSSNGGLKLATPAPISATDHVRGPSDAPVTLIDYGDFQCPACAAYFPLIERLFNESSTTLRMVSRNFPLSQHENAIPSALAAEAAGMQGKYWEMFKSLYENHDEWAEVKDASPMFEKYASEIGLNLETFKIDLKNPDLRKKIEDDRDEGIHIGINHTPTFFVNNKEVIDIQSYEQLKELIQTAAQESSK